MKLSQDFIYFRLQALYEVRYFKKSKSAQTLKRPVFYEDGTPLENCSAIVSAEDLKEIAEKRIPCTDMLFICTDALPRFSSVPDASIILVKSSASPLRVFNDLQEIYNFFDAWDDMLKELSESGSFQDMVDCCDSVICDPISLTDTMFHYIGYSKAMSVERGFTASLVNENNSMPIELVNSIISDKKLLQANNTREIYTIPPIGDIPGDMMCKNIFYLNKYVGKLGIKIAGNDPDRIRYNRAILEHLFHYIEKLYTKHMSFNQEDIFLNSLRNFVSDCLHKRFIVEDRKAKVFHENGWSQGDQLLLVQFRPNPRHDKKTYATYFCAQIEKEWPGSACIEYKGQLILLVNLDKLAGPSEKTFYQELAYFLRENLLIAGLSRIFKDTDDMYAAYEQSRVALEFGILIAPMMWYYKFDDYALSCLLSNCSGSFPIKHICSSKLLTLKDYDSQKGTEYFKTLDVYLECRFNATEAAKKLFIQRSSFLKRIARIQELTGIDFSSNDEMLYHSISFKLLERLKK